MGRLARSTLASGGYVTGIIPSFLVRKEHALTAAQEMLVVEDMHERKQAMFDRVDAFVALARRRRHARGACRTDDLGAARPPRQARPHRRLSGFWRPLLALFAHMNGEGFIRRGFELRYLVAEKIEDVVPMLRAAERQRLDRESEGAASVHNM